MNQPNKLLPVLYGSFIMTLIYIFPIINLINVFCCAGIAAGGFAGVYSYKKQLTKINSDLSAMDGGMIGLLSGFLSAVMVTGFGLMASMFSESNPVSDFINTVGEAGITIPQEMTFYLEKISNEFSEKGFSLTFTLISFISNIILFPLFGAAGALLGVSILNRKKPPKI